MDKKDLANLKEKLPASPGIMRKEEYFNSAVLIPLVWHNGVYNFLFEKRAAHIRQGGEICFPGGEFDPAADSSFKDTALRETIEELGVSAEDISVIGALDTFIGPMGVSVDPFLGEINIDRLDDVKFDKEEVQKIFLRPVSFFTDNKPDVYHVRLEIHPTDFDMNGKVIDTLPVKELNLPDKYSRPWKGRRHRILVYKADGEVIWGITAELINEVVKKLNS